MSDRLDVSEHDALRSLRDAIWAWDANPRRAAQAGLDNVIAIHNRRRKAAEKNPVERWAPLAAELDPRLLDQPDWPATARILQEAHEHGHDVAGTICALIDEASLDDQPAQDLRYRVASRLNMQVEAAEPATAPQSVREVRRRQTDTPDLAAQDRAVGPLH